MCNIPQPSGFLTYDPDLLTLGSGNWVTHEGLTFWMVQFLLEERQAASMGKGPSIHGYRSGSGGVEYCLLIITWILVLFSDLAFQDPVTPTNSNITAFVIFYIYIKLAGYPASPNSTL